MKLNVFTIPPTTRFLPDLAAGICDLAGGIGPDLTRFRILLPTRRACRELQQEFLNISKGKPLLLPRMHPLGDIDQEELDLMIAGTVEAEDMDTLLPPLSPLERQMLLTRYVQSLKPDMRGEQCLSLARALGRLMDQVYTEDLDLAALPDLVSDADLAKHWGETVEFLEILSITWPHVLAEQGRIDSADRRNKLLKRLADYWQSNPPAHPVIAAGSTGSIPATGNLLHVIAGLPQGRVILPGLDTDMDEASWDVLTETHPQNTMKRLITRMGVERSAVKIWRGAKPAHSHRLDIVRAATWPSDTCENISVLKDDLLKGLENVSLVEADNSRHEAQIIALAVRECLETPDKNVVIITPDRNLSRRISAMLKRWNINVDDSAGQPLHMKPLGIFFNKILHCAAENFAPLPLLDFLKTAQAESFFGASTIEELEIRALRGPRPPAGIDGIRKHISKLKNQDSLLSFVDKIESCFAPLLPFTKNTHLLAEFLPALITVAEKIVPDPKILWAGPEGDCLSSLLSELQDTKSHLPPADLATHQAYLQQFMSERKVRSVYGTHPRVTILGQIEARLITADVTIMAGLNEGTWPPEPPNDPWMSRPMRKKFGLPPIERQTGLSAHDFVQAFNGAEVMITRARKMDGTPTVPARWLERLSALLVAAGLTKETLTQSVKEKYGAWAHLLDQPDVVMPALKPAPVPPVDLRPKKLGVTGIETLMRNPYEIYAKYVLNLRPLDPIDEDVSASDRGEFIHHILNEFVTAHPLDLPFNAEEVLLKMGEDHLRELGEDSPDWSYWWPRYKNLVPAFIGHEKEWRKTRRVFKTEIQGAQAYTMNGVDFILTGKADRIDTTQEGAAIIDYKTGGAPTATSVIKGTSPQLSLEAMLLQDGGYAGIKSAPENVSLSYWTLTGKMDPLKITCLENNKNLVGKMGDLVTEARSGFTRLMTAFMSEATPYYPVIPNSKHLYDDQRAYKHLARCDEWGIEGEAGSDEEEAA